MRKMLLLLMVLISGLFANSYTVGNFSVAQNGALQSITASQLDKTIYLDFIYNTRAIVNETNLKRAENKLIRLICTNPQMRTKLENGYEVEVTYMYKGGVIIHLKVNSCPL